MVRKLVKTVKNKGEKTTHFTPAESPKRNICARSRESKKELTRALPSIKNDSLQDVLWKLILKLSTYFSLLLATQHAKEHWKLPLKSKLTFGASFLAACRVDQVWIFLAAVVAKSSLSCCSCIYKYMHINHQSRAASRKHLLINSNSLMAGTSRSLFGQAGRNRHGQTLDCVDKMRDIDISSKSKCCASNLEKVKGSSAVDRSCSL